MYSKQHSWQHCQCHPPHTSAGSPTAHQNQHDGKTGPAVPSLTTTKEASRRRARGTPCWSLEVAAPRLPKWGRADGRGSTALVPCVSSSCCQASSSAASKSYFPGLNPLGKLFTQASSQPQKTCHKLLPCSHPAWPGAQSHWESGPASHVLHEAWLRVWPEATHEPFAAGPLPLDLTTFSIPNASWT